MAMRARGMQRCLKRLIDLGGAGAMLVLCAPLMALIALLLLLRNGAPVIHRETRFGIHGRSFTLYKFRTLRLGTGTEKSVAEEGDARILPIGQFLRRWRLDEFPQLVNVLRGDMSLVGPRPLPEAHARSMPQEVLAELREFAPGLSGPASILYLAEDAVLAGRPDAERCYLDTVLPAKLATELGYVRHWSLVADLRIILLTALWVWSPRAREQSFRRIQELLARSDPAQPGEQRLRG